MNKRYIPFMLCVCYFIVSFTPPEGNGRSNNRELDTKVGSSLTRQSSARQMRIIEKRYTENVHAWARILAFACQ